jgi:hypothetical protein
MKAASVIVENGSYIVSFPYDPSAVNALKNAIPSTACSWDNARKKKRFSIKRTPAGCIVYPPVFFFVYTRKSTTK